MSTDQPEPIKALDVRRFDNDLSAFADLIVELVNEQEPYLVDLSQHEEHGNRITLRVHEHESQES